MKLLQSFLLIAIFYSPFIYASNEAMVESVDEPIVEKVSVEDEPPELQPPPIVTDPEPEVEVESLLTATIDWKNNTEHKLLYGKDNEVSLLLHNKYSEPLTVFTVTGVLSSPHGKQQPRPLNPQRVLSAAAPYKTTTIVYRPRPELEPGEYELEVSVEVISPKVIRLHRINAFKGRVVIHDPSSGFLDIQSVTIYLVLLLMVILVVPPIRRAVLAPLLAPSKKSAKSGEVNPDDWIPNHIKSASSPTTTGAARRRKTVGSAGDS